MEESAKYLIHADVTANGVVEREDVVGAVYGQTEGLLGNELDLRTLQEASKAGRIDVDVDSEGGRSFGELTIASSMDRVETAVLAASLETIGRVGPCRAEFRITAIEDVRAAKRRSVVERAKELLAESFDEPAAESREILEEVRQAVRVEDITEYEGLPAGPNVADSDAIIVVEGRSDVLTLLRYGIKNAVAVEGTDVPDAVADLTRDRTVTAFLDGDRGGDLILKELNQVGDVDYVALAPPDRAVEDLDRSAVTTALRQKIPADQLQEVGADGAAVPTDGGTVQHPTERGTAARSQNPDVDEAARGASGAVAGPDVETDDDVTDGADVEPGGAAGAGTVAGSSGGTDPDPDVVAGEVAGPSADVERGADAGAGTSMPADDPSAGGATSAGDDGADDGRVTGETSDPAAGETGDGAAGGNGDPAARESADPAAGQPDGPAAGDRDGADRPPETLPAHVATVVEGESGTVRLLDDAFDVQAEVAADEAFDAVEAADAVPSAVVLDGELTQRLLDVAAQRGVGQIVAREVGDLVKQPAGVRIRTADQFR